MALARKADNDPLSEAQKSGGAGAGADVAAGWLGAGTGLKIGGQRGGLRIKAARSRAARAGRIKGVKRL
jgi:hypothetical protein